MFARSLVVRSLRTSLKRINNPVTSIRPFCLTHNGGMDFPSLNGQRQSSSLAQVLKNELQEEKANCFSGEYLDELEKHVREVMTVNEEPGNMTVLLSHEQNGEEIEVVFSCQDIEEDTLSDEEFENEESSETQGEEEEEEEVSSLLVRFTARITKNEESLLFNCVANESSFTIEQVALCTDDDIMDENAYRGPIFDDLDAKVQEKFYDYLGDRYINNDLAAFITLYAENKEQKEYVTFLEKTAKFLS